KEDTEPRALAYLNDSLVLSGNDSLLPPSVPVFLSQLSASRLLSGQELHNFLARQPRFDLHETSRLIDALVEQGLLTNYQAARVLTGKPFGLVLGNYLITDHSSVGGMGVVYKAEHIHMKRTVAIKVMVAEADSNCVTLQRFYSEMQATAV